MNLLSTLHSNHLEKTKHKICNNFIGGIECILYSMLILIVQVAEKGMSRDDSTWSVKVKEIGLTYSL